MQGQWHGICCILLASWGLGRPERWIRELLCSLNFTYLLCYSMFYHCASYFAGVYLLRWKGHVRCGAQAPNHMGAAPADLPLSRPMLQSTPELSLHWLHLRVHQWPICGLILMVHGVLGHALVGVLFRMAERLLAQCPIPEPCTNRIGPQEKSTCSLNCYNSCITFHFSWISDLTFESKKGFGLKDKHKF